MDILQHDQADGAMAQSAPMSVAEAEQLLQDFHGTGSNAKHKNDINDRLLRYQHHPDAWNLADLLMSSSLVYARTFAAITFVVKLNNEGHTLDAARIEAVRLRLLTHLAKAASRGDDPLVCQKLCTAATMLFVRSQIPWSRPLQDLVSFFKYGATSPQNSSDSLAPFNEILGSLTGSEIHMKILLWFAGSLAKDVDKLNTNDIRYARHHQEMRATVEDACQILRVAFLSPPSDKIIAEALQTLTDWVTYAQSAWNASNQPISLRELLSLASRFLAQGPAVDEAMTAFQDMLEACPSFFPEQDMLALRGLIYQIAQGEVRNIDADIHTCRTAIGLLNAFSCAQMVEIVENPYGSPTNHDIVQLYLEILDDDTVPGDDDPFSALTMEFWNTYMEHINDVIERGVDDEPGPPWVGVAQATLTTLVERFFKKLWIPSDEQSEAWGDEERKEFADFRIDCTDTMLSMYIFLGERMFEQLVTLILQSLQANNWRGVEAGLLCINQLSSNVLEESANEEAIRAVFESDLFVRVADFTQRVPFQARKTAIDTLGSYGPYIERHPEFLPDTFKFLFVSLEETKLAERAAKNIEELCLSCRMSLTQNISEFLQQYQRFLDLRISESHTKQKVLAGISAIVQALSPEHIRARWLLDVLAFVERDVQASKEAAAAGRLETAEDFGVTALECLARIGKAMRVPDDFPIDLDGDATPTGNGANFWDSEDGRVVQQHIQNCFSVLQVVGAKTEAIDAACEVLRSGFTETEPGPFVLPPSVTVSFVRQCNLSTPGLEAVLATAERLITSAKGKKFTKLTDDDVIGLYSCVANFALQLGTVSNDPSVAAGCINVLQKLMNHFPRIFFANLSEPLVDFALSGVEVTEMLPKRAASSFWSSLIEPQQTALDLDTKKQIDMVIARYGPRLMLALVHQLGGRATRSDVDLTHEPLRALLQHQPNARLWMEEALKHESFPKPAIQMEVRARFLKQVMLTVRDPRQMKAVVKQFWATCYGTVVSL